MQKAEEPTEEEMLAGFACPSPTVSPQNRLWLERRQISGHFNVSAQKSVTVGDTSSFIAGGVGVSVLPTAEMRTTHGEAARGPMIAQQISSEKLGETVFGNLVSQISEHPI